MMLNQGNMSRNFSFKREKYYYMSIEEWKNKRFYYLTIWHSKKLSLNKIKFVRSQNNK